MSDTIIRQQLVNLLTKRQAHMLFDDAVKDFPEAHINTPIPDANYTFWHLIEHIRRTQFDILDYISNPDYSYRDWPKDYWPAPDATTDAAGWARTVQQFRTDLQTLVDIVNDTSNDLNAQIPHGEPGHNILREIIVVGQHNAYHVGELGILRQTMGLW
jgi:hypothetical protein